MLKNALCVLFILANVTWASAATLTAQDAYFKDMDGCFLLYNMKSGALENVIGDARCQERLSPCSTFKIPLAVMAFDAGILKDEAQVLKWDGIHNEREVANHDHDAKT